MYSTQSLVSVVLCTYNGEKYLKEQLESLLFQTYGSLEVIAVDDCSTDRTYTILSDYQKKHPQIRLYQNEKNIGYAKNFEKAISLCQGDFIALCDQDDIWETEKLSVLVQSIEGHILIYHDSRLVDEKGEAMDRKISNLVNFHTGDRPEAFLFFNCISSHAILFRKELTSHLFPFPESGFHDAWIGYVACNMGTIHALDECLVRYRQHPQSATDILKRKGQSNRVNKKDNYMVIIGFLKRCMNLSINKNPAFIRKLFHLYNGRTRKYFSFSLLLFFIRNYHLLFIIYKRSFISKINFAIKHSRGINRTVYEG